MKKILLIIITLFAINMQISGQCIGTSINSGTVQNCNEIVTDTATLNIVTANSLVVATTINASINGNAATVTTIPNLNGAITNIANTTSLGAFSSADLSTALGSDKTGNGLATFATSPVFNTDITTPSIIGTGDLHLSSTSNVLNRGKIYIGKLCTLNDSLTMFGIGTQNPTAILHITKSASAPAWGTVGIGLRINSTTYVDTTSNGTVAFVNIHNIGIPTYSSTHPTTLIKCATLNLGGAPVVGLGCLGINNPFTLNVMSGNSYFEGKIMMAQTVTSTGTTGNRTINKPSGTVNIAAGGTTVTVTNSFVTTASGVLPVIRTNDATAAIKNCVSLNGSFIITLTAAATSEISIFFVVFD